MGGDDTEHPRLQQGATVGVWLQPTRVLAVHKAQMTWDISVVNPVNHSTNIPELIRLIMLLKVRVSAPTFYFSFNITFL